MVYRRRYQIHISTVSSPRPQGAVLFRVFMSEAGPSLQSCGDVVFRRFIRTRHSLLEPSAISLGT
eukprot:5186803-Pyramimonas_sp.AAC.1